MVFGAESTTKDYIRAKTNVSLSPIYSAHESSNHTFHKNHKISPDTTYLKQNIHKRQTQNVRTISPFVIAPV